MKNRYGNCKFSERKQKWEVVFSYEAGAYGEYAGRDIDVDLVIQCRYYGMDTSWLTNAEIGKGFTYLFNTYEDAVRAENAVLNSLRAAGKL